MTRFTGKQALGWRIDQLPVDAPAAFLKDVPLEDLTHYRLMLVDRQGSIVQR